LVCGAVPTPPARVEPAFAGLHATFKDILLRGVLAPAGMERFNDILSDQDAENVHACLIEQSWIAYRTQEGPGAHK